MFSFIKRIIKTRKKEKPLFIVLDQKEFKKETEEETEKKKDKLEKQREEERRIGAFHKEFFGEDDFSATTTTATQSKSISD